MIEDNYLPYFINEHIFIVQEPRLDDIDQENEEPKASQNARDDEGQSTKIPLLVLTGVLSVENKSLFSKILEALGKSLNDVTIIENLNNELPDFEKLMIFGDHPVNGTDMSYYNIVDHSTRWLRSKSLEDIARSKEEKTKLWKALQRWFKLS